MKTVATAASPDIRIMLDTGVGAELLSLLFGSSVVAGGSTGEKVK